MPDVTEFPIVSSGRLTPDAAAWLAEAFATAERLNERDLVVTIHLSRGGFTVRGVCSAMRAVEFREVSLERAMALAPNLLAAAAVAVHRKLIAGRRAGSPATRTPFARQRAH